jgi:hypothetical protein
MQIEPLKLLLHALLTLVCNEFNPISVFPHSYLWLVHGEEFVLFIVTTTKRVSRESCEQFVDILAEFSSHFNQKQLPLLMVGSGYISL